MHRERVLVAVGGNSLQDSSAKGPAGPGQELGAVRTTAESLAEVVAAGYGLVLTHGNGPQVGFGLQMAELAAEVAPVRTLDAIDADTQGSLGYLIQQALGNALRARGLDDRVASVVTQVLVDADDPAFQWPQKPVGRAYTEQEARRKISELGWNMVREKKRGWRRVVPSPQPRRIVEAWAIASLVAAGAVVVGCGGGGIPVVPTAEGLRGVAAVIDKDRASALLARSVAVSTIVFSTGVEQLYLDFGEPSERPLPRLSAAEAAQHLAAGQFPPGSMGPKIEASLDFLRAGGSRAIITSPERIAAALAGQAGTCITP